MRRMMRQLRWRLAFGPMLVVVVGVGMMFLMTALIVGQASAVVLPELAGLLMSETPAVALETTANRLLLNFREAMTLSVALAAIAALAAGLVMTYFLSRDILRPLQAIAHSSQRIAAGRYDERIPEPGSEELALVADHFNQMAEALAQVEQQRVALMGDVTHELRTPLAGLEGYLEGLMDGVFTADEETVVAMQHEVRRLRRLVEDIQALSRAEAGAVALHLQVFDLLETTRQATTRLIPQAEAQGLHIAPPLPALPVLVHADPDRTSQIVINLIGNAIQYTPAGGHIQVQVTMRAQEAVVQVADTGIGLDPETLPYIFERFYRVDPSRSRHSGGSGVGLTISRHLAWAMGGELTVASPGLGQGSVFTLTLPLA